MGTIKVGILAGIGEVGDPRAETTPKEATKSSP